MDSNVKRTVERFQSGDREAFAALVSQFQNLVTAVALSESGDFQRSEDIAQQSFMLAWEKQRELKDPTRFAAWLRGIARNLARNDRRLKSNLQSRSSLTIVDANEPATSTLTPLESDLRDEQREMLWETLQRIPEEYREPMILFYREEKSVRTTAEQLGLSEDAVKQRLRRGRAMLKEEIQTMVEDLLFDSRPSPVFSAGVMAALPVTNTATKAGLFLGAKTMFAKLLGGLGAGAALGLLGGLVGTCGGIFGAWVGTQNSIKHATSEEEKRAYRTSFASLTFISIVFFAGLICWGQSFPGAVPIFAVIYFCGLLGCMYWLTRRVRALHRIHGRPKHLGLQEFVPQPVSRKELVMSTAGVAIFSCCWFPLYCLRLGSFTTGAIAAVAMAGHAWRLWRETELAKKVLDQMRLNGRAVLEACCIQSSLLFVAWLAGAKVAVAPLEGLPEWMPFWAVVPLPMLIGIVVWQVLRMRAQDLEEDLAERDAAR